MENIDYQVVLKQTQEYYGETKASYHFAAGRFARLQIIEDYDYLINEFSFLDSKAIEKLKQRRDILKQTLRKLNTD